MTKELDTKGLNCPLPVLKAQKAMKELEPGETLTVYATDPGSVKDFEAFSRSSGNELVKSETSDECFTFILKKAG
ncbi:MAG: sulfurtransferase TusA family protein [Rhodospirillales bacterium]|nr:sulfurtransferase TusA family protein [Rhodospirillales bacterium]